MTDSRSYVALLYGWGWHIYFLAFILWDLVFAIRDLALWAIHGWPLELLSGIICLVCGLAMVFFWGRFARSRRAYRGS